MPAPNMSMVNMSSNQLMLPASASMQPVVQSSSALQVATGVRPYVPRPVINPMLQHWPPAKDNSLPKEGWFLVNDLWVFLPPNYQYDITELQQSSNCNLMQGCFEVPWKQNPTIFVLLEFQHLLIYDSEGPLQILDNTEIKDPASSKSAKFDFNRLNAVMLWFRMIATRSACRMRSISELKVREYEQGKEVDFKIIQLTAAYLTSVVENPDSLAVDASYWQQLAEIHCFSARDVMDIRAHELMFHGVEEWSLRLLSHGRPDSVIPTRSVAESILGSHILSVVRKQHYDIDGTAEAIWRHVHPDKEPPSKNSDSTQLFQPMIDMMLASIASFAPTQQSSAASQNLIKLETELEKRSSNFVSKIEQDDSPLTKLDAIPAGTFSSNAKKLQGQSIPAVQTWCKTFKKTLGATKFAEFEELTEEIASQIDDANNKLTKDKSRELAIKFGLPIASQIDDANNKLTKDKSRELAIKFGLPMSAVNKMGVKSLASVIALASVLAA
eukprot:s2390_g1.t1